LLAVWRGGGDGGVFRLLNMVLAVFEPESNVRVTELQNLLYTLMAIVITMNSMSMGCSPRQQYHDNYH
jgi:hypothetical protein